MDGLMCVGFVTIQIAVDFVIDFIVEVCFSFCGC